MRQAIAATVLIALSSGAVQAGEALFQGGSYEVIYRLELPHIENGAATGTRTVCLRSSGEPSPGFAVLSGNNPLSGCPIRNVRSSGHELSFEILCEGSNSAKGRAVYALAEQGFRGRIAITTGGKNMTMTEVQVGRRLGPCADAPASQ